MNITEGQKRVIELQKQFEKQRKEQDRLYRAFVSGEQFEKPPIGLKPHILWLEERLEELEGAMTRYARAGKQIPNEWSLELLELAKFLL